MNKDRNGLQLVDDNYLSPELAQLDTLLLVLDRLRQGPPISDEVQRWAREDAAGGMLGEMLANPKRFKWLFHTAYWSVLYSMLCDVTPEVLSHKELGHIDCGITIHDNLEVEHDH